MIEGRNILHVEDTTSRYVIAARKHFWQMHASYVREIRQCRPDILCALSTKIILFWNASASSWTIDFLKERKLEYKSFDDAFHWLMIDKVDEFYSFLKEFVS